MSVKHTHEDLSNTVQTDMHRDAEGYWIKAAWCKGCGEELSEEIVNA